MAGGSVVGEINSATPPIRLWASIIVSSAAAPLLTTASLTRPLATFDMAKARMSEPLAVYESRPPEWLPKTHLSADLGTMIRPASILSTHLSAGYVGFFPPRPHQVEETLTESNVKNGLVLAPAVPVRTIAYTEDRMDSSHFL